MFDSFGGSFGTGDFSVTIGGTGGGWGYPNYPTYPTTYPTTYPNGTWSGTWGNQNNQLLMIGLVVVAAVLLLKK